MSFQPEKNSRIKEPSTWGGLATVVLGGIFAKEAPELATPEFVGGLLAVASGLVAVFRRETR